MDWTNAVIAGVCGVVIWWFGFCCGYAKDKKEVGDSLLESKYYYEEAEKQLNEAQKLLDTAHNYYEEVHAELKVIAGMRGEE